MTWREALVATSGVALIGVVVVVVVWQLLATWRARMSGAREMAYRALAEDATAAQSRAAIAMEQVLAELRGLHARTGELERVLKEVE